MCVYMGLLKLRDVEMTQKTKLEIIGPYTPEHEGPFCLDDEERTPVELKIRDARGEFPLKGYVGDDEHLSSWSARGRAIELNIMNAREVPVARETELSVREDEHFRAAVASYRNATGTGSDFFVVSEILSSWLGSKGMDGVLVREVLPGEVE